MKNGLPNIIWRGKKRALAIEAHLRGRAAKKEVMEMLGPLETESPRLNVSEPEVSAESATATNGSRNAQIIKNK